MHAPTLAPDDSTIPTIKALDLDAITRPGRYRFALDMVGNGLGSTIRIPVVVVRGRSEGPTLGLTAVVHGNELNGIMVIHRVLTSGGETTVARGLGRIAALVGQATGRISIMPGSGVGPGQVATLKALGITELHASCSAPMTGDKRLAALGFAPAELRQTDLETLGAMRQAME